MYLKYKVFEMLSFSTKLNHSSSVFNIIRKFSSPVEETLGIPKYVNRSKTDILKALGSTITRDPTAPEYKFYDDPYLIPHSENRKVMYSLSKESGRKAARWIRDTRPTYFHQQFDDPIIPDYSPQFPIEDNEHHVHNEELLRKMIDKFEISNAIKVYEICVANGEEISEDCLQNFLESLVYYQEKDPPSLEWTESLQNSQMMKLEDQPLTRPLWKCGGIAEDLFNQLRVNGSKPYCAMIRGYIHCLECDLGIALYEEALDKGIDLDTETYNLVITACSSYSPRKRWQGCLDIMETMNIAGVAPNVGTFTACISVLNGIRSIKGTDTFALNLWKELCHLKITPGLAFYYHLMKIFYKNRNDRSDILVQIIDKLEIQNITISHRDDVLFFREANEVAFHFKDFSLLNRINNIVMDGNNIDLFVSMEERRQYFNNYILNAMRYIELDDFMKIYSQYHPNIHTFDSRIYSELIKEIALLNKMDLISSIWLDIIAADLASSYRVVTQLLDLMLGIDELSSQTKENFRIVAKELYDKNRLEDADIKFKFKWTGEKVGKLLRILVKLGDSDTICDILSTLLRNNNIIASALSENVLKEIFDISVTNKNERLCSQIQSYASKNDYESFADMAKQISENYFVPQ